MPRFSQRTRWSNDRKPYERWLPSLPGRLSDEATSIYIRNLPASANKQSLHDWCQRTLCKGLDADDHQKDGEGIIDDIWIAKPVAIRCDPADENVDGKTQQFRYAHVRFQHRIFKRLMMAHAKPEEYDGVSKPEIQRWKSKTTRHKERKLIRTNVKSKEDAPVASVKQESGPSSEAVECTL